MFKATAKKGFRYVCFRCCGQITGRKPNSKYCLACEADAYKEKTAARMAVYMKKRRSLK